MALFGCIHLFYFITMGIFSTADQERIVHAISVAESKTSGEIRLVVERKLALPTALDAAVSYFAKLKMHQTQLQNGVLIYIAVDDHQFAIIGDKGINARVEANFWDTTKETMLNLFKANEIASGLVAGIKHAGEQLQAYYPRQLDDVNELPDDIYFGKN